MFKVGQKVICIKSFKDLKKIWGFNYPKKNDIVEVLSIREHHAINDFLISVSELECEVCASYFKPIEYDIISNKEIIKKIITEKSDFTIKEYVLN